jgi:CBS domain-containing protein
LKVADVMSAPVICMHSTEPVAHARNLMLRHKVKHLVVLEKGKPVGTLSTKDFAKAMMAESGAIDKWRPIDDFPVSRVINGKLVTVDPSTHIAKAASMMLKHGISGIPIVKNEELVGILTKTDIARYFASNMVGRVRVMELMTSKIITANRQHSLRHILGLMEQNKVGRVVITDGGRPIGIVTTADIIFAQLGKSDVGAHQQMVKFTRKAERASRPKYRYVKSFSITAENIMRSELLTISADEDAARAASTMLESGISGLPVIKDDKLIGIITKTDITRKVVEMGG